MTRLKPIALCAAVLLATGAQAQSWSGYQVFENRFGVLFHQALLGHRSQAACEEANLDFARGFVRTCGDGRRSLQAVCTASDPLRRRDVEADRRSSPIVQVGIGQLDLQLWFTNTTRGSAQLICDDMVAGYRRAGFSAECRTGHLR